MKSRLFLLLAFTAGIALGVLVSKPSVVNAQSARVKITKVMPMNMGTVGGSELIAGSVVGFSCTGDSQGNSECYILSQ